MATVIADNIISPLGTSTQANYQAVKAGKSALRLYREAPGIPFSFTASLFSDEQKKEFLIDGYTAFESLAMAEGRTVLHGYAVAWGLVCELYLSVKRLGFPKERFSQTIQFIKENYGTFAFGCKQYDSLYELMTHDKKNTSGEINFTLLSDIGDIRINQTATREEIMDMLDFYQEGI